MGEFLEHTYEKFIFKVKVGYLIQPARVLGGYSRALVRSSHKAPMFFRDLS